MALRKASTWPCPQPGFGLLKFFIGRCGRGLTPQHPTEPTIKVIEAVAGGDSNARLIISVAWSVRSRRSSPVGEKRLMLEGAMFKESLVTKSNQVIFQLITDAGCGRRAQVIHSKDKLARRRFLQAAILPGSLQQAPK
jgi:hypothetical protein